MFCKTSEKTLDMILSSNTEEYLINVVQSILSEESLVHSNDNVMPMEKQRLLIHL